jgi:hypothetical protein
MTILHPKALAWAILAVPILLLYLRRIRRRRHLVGAAFLWEQVLPKGRSDAARRFRQPVSLCLQLAILGLVVLALAEPRWRRPVRLVLVVDNSASMNATDVKPTRLDEAKRLARQHIAALGDRDEMALLSAGDLVRMHMGLSSQKRSLESALEEVTASDGPTPVAEAAALGRRLLAGQPDGKILVLSDGCFEGAVELAAEDDVQLVPVGDRSDNVAVTRLEARRSPADPRQCQVLAEVTSYADQPVRCHLELELDGRPVDAMPIELDPDDRWQHVFEMSTAEEGRLTARLDRPDFFAADDHASTRLPSCRVPRVTSATEGNPHPENTSDGPALPGVPSAGGTGDERPGARRPAPGESDLRRPAGLAAQTAPAVVKPAGPPLWPVPAALALLLLVAEWCLFQRRWTC